MARTKTKWPELDLEPLVEMMGGMDAVIRKLGVKRVLDEVDLETLVGNLLPGKKRELKRRLAEEDNTSSS